MTDWSTFRKCPVCFAALGFPCISETRAIATGSGTRYDPILRDRPHSRRKQLAGAVSD